MQTNRQLNRLYSTRNRRRKSWWTPWHTAATVATLAAIAAMTAAAIKLTTN